jgi:toxin ParE1/3/4
MGVRWTTPAARDFANICDYIQEHDGPTPARRVALSIYDRLDSLAEFPHRGRQGRVPGTRELVMSGLPYLAVYRIKDDVVEIVRVLHGAQKWP